MFSRFEHPALHPRHPQMDSSFTITQTVTITGVHNSQKAHSHTKVRFTTEWFPTTTTKQSLATWWFKATTTNNLFFSHKNPIDKIVDFSSSVEKTKGFETSNSKKNLWETNEIKI